MTLQEGKGRKLYVVGNYRFSGKLLGKGNFARVEEALHTVLNIKVAVKIMELSQIKEDYVIRNLCREAKLMAKLNHPCVCALYQTMQRSDNVYYLVTELASGGDLCTFVKEQRGGRLEERPSRIYARQFVSALAHMHYIGVVHRDLKMENVMLNSARTQIKIVDFGLSNIYSPNEPLKTHCGSPEYAAPELFITGMKYGPEVDLWSLGIIVYGMVVHRDLKMENVMLNSARTQIKIVDFGLSNIYSPNEPLKTHCGSPEYAAPELFITGMKYGPEVDLWSLGIILYGMVVGQLPFVSNRNDQMSSQERRKKLVAQINKGLGNSHKRALANFSPDFRNMIGRMLVPDITKRISIKEMVTHPFITERGTRLIRSNPIKKLDVRHQASIIAEICELMHLPSDQVIQMIKQEPFSRIGGMYNILSHRLALNRLSGDGITKVQPALELDCKARSIQDSPVKRPYNLRNLSAKPLGGRGDDYTPRVIVQDRKLSSQQNGRPPTTPPNLTKPRPECRRPCSPCTGTRPRTVQPRMSEKKVNSREIRTPLMTRKAYSAGITPKTNRPTTATSPIAKKVSSTMNTKMTRDVAKRLCPAGNMNGETEKQSTKDAVNKKTSSPLPNGLKINLKREKSVDGIDTRTKMALDRRQRSKSEKLPGTRPATTTPGVLRKTLVVTHSDSKAATNRPQTTSSIKESRPFAKLLKLSRPAMTGHAMEKSAMAYGDIAQKNQALCQKMKKPTIYDPIARSIAEYVCNNVSNKLPHLSHFKK